MIEQIQSEALPVIQQIGMLNLRISDMMTQLNVVMKALMDENCSLKNENANLKSEIEKIEKS